MKIVPLRPAVIAVLGMAPALRAAPPEFRWKEVEIDRIEIGYGLQLADVDGDGKTDVVLADKSTIQWYANPGWEKHVIARELTKRDNVCVTARDIDGDGKCEIAVGGQWNFLETMKDGAVFFLVAPADRTRPWTPVALPHDPSTHRMHWVKGAGTNEFSLVVKPLRGMGSVDGVGPGIRILEYLPPEDRSDAGEWKRRLVGDRLNLSHNFHPVNWDDDPEEELIVAAKQGVWHFDRVGGEWRTRQLTTDFAGEIRDGRLPGGRRFIATVEPMHGTAAAVYVEPENGEGLWPRLAMLAEGFKDGHALACADFLGTGSDQIVVGWRAMNPPEQPGEPGIRLFTPLDAEGKEWRATEISGPQVAVEDLKAADLNGDGLADLVAAARQTKNLKIFFAAP